MVAIGIPWPNLPDASAEDYAAEYVRVAEPVYPLVDSFREKHPDNSIFVIPHGKGVVELHARFREGNLSEIKSLFPPGNDAFFTDRGCHAGRMAVAVSRLIFLATIYETDPRRSDWATGLTADLKQIAYDVVKGEPYARLAKRVRSAASIVKPENKE